MYKYWFFRWNQTHQCLSVNLAILENHKSFCKNNWCVDFQRIYKYIFFVNVKLVCQLDYFFYIIKSTIESHN